MSTEIVAITMYVLGYAGFWILYFCQVRGLQKENKRLQDALFQSNQTLAVHQAAKSGDFETARLMAAVKREAEKTKPPVSAGAKPKQPEGVVFTEGIG